MLSHYNCQYSCYYYYHGDYDNEDDDYNVDDHRKYLAQGEKQNRLLVTYRMATWQRHSLSCSGIVNNIILIL